MTQITTEVGMALVLHEVQSFDQHEEFGSLVAQANKYRVNKRATWPGAYKGEVGRLENQRKAADKVWRGICKVK